MDFERLKHMAGIEPLNEDKTLNEVAPDDQEDFIKKAKDEFKKRYGKRWKQVLYATAWKMHDKNVKESEAIEIADSINILLNWQKASGLEETLSEAWESRNSLFFVYGRCERKSSKISQPNMKMAVQEFAGKPVEHLSGDPVLSSESNPVKYISSDGDACEYVAYRLMDESIAIEDLEKSLLEAEKPHESDIPKVTFMDGQRPANTLDMSAVEFDDDKTAVNKVMTGQDVEEAEKVNVPADVMTSITKRINELQKSIETYDEAGYNQDGAKYKNVKYTAIDVLEKFKKLLSSKNVREFKEAQVYYGTLMSPITDLLPSKLVNFLHDKDKKKI